MDEGSVPGRGGEGEGLSLTYSLYICAKRNVFKTHCGVTDGAIIVKLNRSNQFLTTTKLTYMCRKYLSGARICNCDLAKER